MKFEDILPALRAGRIARRASWPTGHCIIANLDPRFESNITHHQKYDRDSSYGSWNLRGIDRDLLGDDWELVPEVDKERYQSGKVRSLLTEMALLVQREIDAGRGYNKDNLAVMVHEAIEVHAKAVLDKERLKTTLVHGLLALFQEPQ